ncbi:MAG: thermonuclease family protein [Candidatus Bipolaricaulota bacterium]|nr:thermonuclease family protein [Candidatus Bipolaricaulota bacterium]
MAAGAAVAVAALVAAIALHGGDAIRPLSGVVEVTDGDTIRTSTPQLRLRSGAITNSIRLAGIDAPEGGTPWSEEAKDALASLVAKNRLSVRQVHVSENSNWDRALGFVFKSGDPLSLNETMLAAGWARVYTCEETESDLQAKMVQAQLDAVRNRRGFWSNQQDLVIAAIQYWLEDEQLFLMNRGTVELSLDDLYIEDAAPSSPHRLSVVEEAGRSSILPGETLEIRTRRVWNDGGDQADLHRLRPDGPREEIDSYVYKGPS